MAGWLCAAGALCVAICLRPDLKVDGVGAVPGDRSRVTKPNTGDREERELSKKNRLKEFEAARKPGMTEDVVRKVVEDYFETLAYADQPHRPVEEILCELRAKRLSLYLDALADGFNLTPEQKLDAQAKLPALAAQQVTRLLLLESIDRSWDVSLIGVGGKISEPSPLTRSEQIEVIVGQPISLTDEGIRPWELCELNEKQKQMIGSQDDAGEWIWVDGGEKTFDFGTTESYEHLSDPFVKGAGVITTAGKIFPLSMSQMERFGRIEDEGTSPPTANLRYGNDLERVKLLTQPQLKTLLLFSSEMPAKLLKDLEE